MINVNLSAQELQDRLKQWKAPAPKYTTGVLGKYSKLVQSASKGAIV